MFSIVEFATAGPATGACCTTLRRSTLLRRSNINGTVNVKVLPCPSTLSTVSVPPSRVAKAFEIANPKPVPFSERCVSCFT